MQQLAPSRIPLRPLAPRLRQTDSHEPAGRAKPVPFCFPHIYKVSFDTLDYIRDNFNTNITKPRGTFTDQTRQPGNLAPGDFIRCPTDLRWTQTSIPNSDLVPVAEPNSCNFRGKPLNLSR
eukprot:GHVT01015342.1.p1 GENE.GHVT01015342.1~~GHVT01015342.1.p1  ORF type:complete len:121 (+),score=2.62 GHVT01015342.1:854-1216(+)